MTITQARTLRAQLIAKGVIRPDAKQPVNTKAIAARQHELHRDKQERKPS